MRRLDGRYPKLNATDVVLRVVTRDLPVEKIPEFLTSVQGLDAMQANKAGTDLQQAVLIRVLGLLQPRPAPAVAPSPAPAAPPAPPAALSSRPPLSVPPASSSRAPVAPPTGVKPASEFFHAEDEADIAKHRERLGQMQPGPAGIPEVIADRIAGESGLKFSDENLAARYRSIAVAALKGIRKNYDTKDLLTRSSKIGGLELSADVADKLLAAFAAHASELGAAVPLPSGLPTVPAMPRPVIRPGVPAAPTIPRRPPSAPIVDAAAPPPPPNLPVGSAELQGAVAPTAATGFSIPTPSVTPPGPSVVPPLPPSPSATPAPQSFRPAPAPRVLGSRGRPVVEDVRRPKRTVGPVDELGLLTADDLRRLDRDPELALTKVWTKVQNLGKESFALFAQGVKAWRSSPLYQLYVAMGTESMATGRAVDEVANNRHAQNQPTLTPHEFELIADFNRHLRL